MWMLYLAIEPWIRRNWPQAIISWSRLVSGQLRDPVVGRDILFGVAFGTLWLVIFQLSNIPLSHMGAAPSLEFADYLMGGRHASASGYRRFLPRFSVRCNSSFSCWD